MDVAIAAHADKGGGGVRRLHLCRYAGFGYPNSIPQQHDTMRTILRY